jgi:catechol 2,3-dioxygenase
MSTIGVVQLTIGDLDRAGEYYEKVIGLRPLERSGDRLALGAEPGRPLVELVGDPDAPIRPDPSTGLFHLALLVPSRPELARALHRVLREGGTLTGASDHLVSEALYLRDPEGNGIELYRDRPRDEWRYVDGDFQMATLPLDLQDLAGELPDESADPGMPAGTTMGHVHLQVSDVGSAEAFYNGVLGFDVTVRSYPGAVFLARDGYHHHIGANTWASEGAPAPPAGSRGLRAFEVKLGRDELAAIRDRAAASGLDAQADDGGLALTDPAGNRVLVRPA